ncbi:cyclin-A1 [Gadus chalcogrammus]|uniref:cyclin-A1 n=1 Tax=Gadus chalcogrammus TaxID=1042646 RepID=UPI0024C3353F|nr:cyclin-A1 [Gadus chalcogrammus]
MSFGMTSHVGIYTNQENASAFTKTEMAAVQKTKPRTVLAVLTENEQRSRMPLGEQCSSSMSTAFTACSGYDVYIEEKCAVITASVEDMDAVGSSLLEEDHAALQHRDFRLFLDLSTNSCADTSMQSLAEEPLAVQDELCVPEYTGDIYRHLREREAKLRPRQNYLSNHPELSGCMRLVLVDWLAEVAEEYKLCAETLHLAVSYLDRFLSYTTSVKRAKLQLVGTVALLLAAKYEEIYPPEMEDFVYITDGTYEQKQLVRMEVMFLKVLAFNMTVPSAYQFLRLFITIQAVCSKTTHLALYVAELSLLDMEMLVTFPPSLVAAAAYCLANYTLSRGLWPDSLEEFTGYTLTDIVPCLKDLHRIHFSAESRPQQAVRGKYKSSKYGSVSLMTPSTTLPFP